jgi:hypothetical protein
VQARASVQLPSRAAKKAEPEKENRRSEPVEVEGRSIGQVHACLRRARKI